MRRTTRAAAQGQSAGLMNMTPMIDVVFLLIIFFLVSSHLARRETRLQLALPTAATGASTNDDSPRVTINLKQDGSLLIGGEPIDVHGLVSRLQSSLAKHGDKLRVRLRGDEQTDYALVEPILAACTEAGVVDIGLAVTPSTQRGGRAP